MCGPWPYKASRRCVRRWLTLLLGIALALRVGGIRYGLPYFVHPDESILVPLAVQFLTGDLNPHFFNWPTLYMYVLAGVYTVYGAILQAVEGISAVAAFVRDPTPFYLIGRAVGAVVGTVSVGLTYVLGVRVHGAHVGLAASFFLAVNLQHVVDSHFATTDVPVTCLIVATVLATLGYWHRGRCRDAVAAGLLGGLAASVKYNGGLVGVVFVVAHVLRIRAAGASWRATLSGWVLPAWLGGAAFGFLAGTPFAALSPGEFTRGVFGEVRAIGTVQFGNEGDPQSLLFHLLHSLPQAMGLPLLLGAGAGIVVALWRRHPAYLILLAFPLPYLGVIATWDSRFERYAVPLLPFASVLAAMGIAELARGWAARSAIGLVAAVVLVSLPAVVRVLRYEMLLTRSDSRELAGEWIERNIPAGARVAMERYSPPIRWGDAAPASRLMLSQPLGLAERLPRPRRVVDAPARLNVSPLDLYDVARMRAHGIEYIILSSFMYKRYLESCERFPMPCRFYRDLDTTATLVFAERPFPEDRRLWVGDIYAPVSQVFARTRPGPTIKIYQLRSERLVPVP